jgi:putative transposase
MVKTIGKLSVRRQCALLSLTRSGLDYKPVGSSQDDVEVMRNIDREHTRHPFYGSRKIVLALAKEGRTVNRLGDHPKAAIQDHFKTGHMR